MIDHRRALLVAGLALLTPACTEAGAGPVEIGTGSGESASGSHPTENPGPSISPTPAPPPGCPLGTVKIDAFCIDRHEAHLVVREPGGAVTQHPHFQRLEEGVTYEARSLPGVFPQGYISRVEAEAACSNAGKRLCSRKEWMRACQGEAHTTYPYGPKREAGRCNTEKRHLLTLKFGADPGRWAYAQFNDPSLDQEPGFLAKTADYEKCAGPEGVHDLVGNLHEWVSDTADGNLRSRLATEGIHRAFQYWSPGNGVFMGGFYSTQGELGPGCTFTTIAHEPRYHDYSTGFRCCADAP